MSLIAALVADRLYYKKVFEELKEAQNALSKLDEDEGARKREIDYLTYQADEIEKANLIIGEV